MKYQEVIDRQLGQYKEVELLSEANIFHMYAVEEWGLDNNGDRGFNDTKLFELIAYNTVTMEKCNLGIKDGVQLHEKPSYIKLYIDGSTLIQFREVKRIGYGQCLDIGDWQKEDYLNNK